MKTQRDPTDVSQQSARAGRARRASGRDGATAGDPRLGSPADKSKPRRRRLRSLSMLPTLLTLGNLLCGFAAVYFGLQAMFDLGAGTLPGAKETLNSQRWEQVLPTWLSVGAFMVILGMVLDGFDGLVARVTRSTTDFGGQLDSLADVVTCGVAPAILMVAYMMRELRGEFTPSPVSASVWGKIAWLTAAIYVAFAAIRLARYNVEHARDDFDHRTFRGLPSPGAAAMMVSFIFLHDQLPAGMRGWIAYAFPVFAFITACLMVSRIPYRRAQAYFRRRKPFHHVILAVLLVALFFLHKTAMLVLLVVCYVFSGPVIYLIRSNRLKRAAAGEAKPDSPAPSS